MKIVPIHFKVRKWQFNHKAPTVDLETDLVFGVRPFVRKKKTDVQGLVFTWSYVVRGRDIEVLYFSTEDQYMVEDSNFTDSEITDIIRVSYDYSNMEFTNLVFDEGYSMELSEFTISGTEISNVRAVLNFSAIQND